MSVSNLPQLEGGGLVLQLELEDENSPGVSSVVWGPKAAKYLAARIAAELMR